MEFEKKNIVSLGVHCSHYFYGCVLLDPCNSIVSLSLKCSALDCYSTILIM